MYLVFVYRLRDVVNLDELAALGNGSNQGNTLMNFIHDKANRGISYSPRYLLNRYGSGNCFEYGKEVYAVEYDDQLGDYLVSFYKYRDDELMCTAAPSKEVINCAAFEVDWFKHEVSVQEKELYGFPRREANETDKAEGRRTETLYNVLPVPKIASRLYGRVVYLEHSRRYQNYIVNTGRIEQIRV